jgi:hypothetical protein
MKAHPSILVFERLFHFKILSTYYSDEMGRACSKNGVLEVLEGKPDGEKTLVRI